MTTKSTKSTKTTRTTTGLTDDNAGRSSGMQFDNLVGSLDREALLRLLVGAAKEGLSCAELLDKVRAAK